MIGAALAADCVPFPFWLTVKPTGLIVEKPAPLIDRFWIEIEEAVAVLRSAVRRMPAVLMTQARGVLLGLPPVTTQLVLEVKIPSQFPETKAVLVAAL